MNNLRSIRILLTSLGQPARLDRVLRMNFPGWGRRTVQSLINAGKVKVNGRAVRLCSWEVKEGDRIEVVDPPEERAPSPSAFDPAWIIAEEEDLIAVNKPAGLLSHASHGRKKGDLLSLAIGHFGPLSLFHRLDRDTSGVVILTIPGPVNKYLDAAFKQGRIEKEYIAVVRAPNRLASEGVIAANILPHPRRHDMMAVSGQGGKRSVTRYKVLAEAEGMQWIKLFPETGRTHQLRVHLAHMGAPILGDRLYAPRPINTKEGASGMARLMLHAQRISLPEWERFPARTYEAFLPADFLRH